MKNLVAEFEQQGFVAIQNIITPQYLEEISRHCAQIELTNAGTRNMLSRRWVVKLSKALQADSRLAALLPTNAKSIQCTYFNKNKAKNWLVAPHRDTTIQVKEKFEAEGWSAWSRKEGGHFVRPPESVLQSLVAVRLHLEKNTSENGALRVMPTSHIVGEYQAQDSKLCCVDAGAALIMRPLLLHSSSKLKSGQRRVLHFVFGPEQLPFPAQWAYAV